MRCCTCECDGKESETIAFEEPTGTAQTLQFIQSGKSIQHPLKAALRSTNADAFAANSHVICIADGVSTVEDEGLDPSELPVELLSNCLLECKARMENSLLFDAECEDLLSDCDVDLYSSNFPLYVLSRASAQCTTYGSTTCVLAILENNRIWSANIGDSQLIVVRRTDIPPKAYPRAQDFSYTTCHDSRCRVPNHGDYGGYQIVYRTVPQQHFFNCPYQLSRMPDSDCSGAAILKRTAQTADVGSAEVQPGDIVILGTDGLFDNVFDDDVLELLNNMCWQNSEPDKPPTTHPDVIVDALLDIAVKAGQPPPGVSSPIITPFSKAAFDEVGRRLVGGKPDDITAVVAYIVPANGAHGSHTTLPSETSLAATTSQDGQLTGENELSTTNMSEPQETNGTISRDISSVGAQLSILEMQGKTLLPRSQMWGSRSSFPPRLRDVTTPAIKASIHSVPRALKATEYMTFEHLKQKAQLRVQRVVSAGPPRTPPKPGVERGWLPEKTSTFLNSIRGFFYGNQ